GEWRRVGPARGGVFLGFGAPIPAPGGVFGGGGGGPGGFAGRPPRREGGGPGVSPPQPPVNSGPVDQLTSPMTLSGLDNTKTGAPESPVQAPNPPAPAADRAGESEDCPAGPSLRGPVLPCVRHHAPQLRSRRPESDRRPQLVLVTA